MMGRTPSTARDASVPPFLGISLDRKFLPHSPGLIEMPPFMRRDLGEHGDQAQFEEREMGVGTFTRRRSRPSARSNCRIS